MKMTLIKLIGEYTVCIFMVILNHGTIKDYVFFYVGLLIFSILKYKRFRLDR